MGCSVSRYVHKIYHKVCSSRKKTGIEVKRPLFPKQIAQSHFSCGTIFHLYSQGKVGRGKNRTIIVYTCIKRFYITCFWWVFLSVFCGLKEKQGKKGYFRGVAAIILMEVHDLVSKNWDSESSYKLLFLSRLAVVKPLIHFP